MKYRKRYASLAERSMQALNLNVLRKCNKFWNPIYFYLTTISAASREPFLINNVFERLYFRMDCERALNSAERTSKSFGGDKHVENKALALIDDISSDQ